MRGFEGLKPGLVVLLSGVLILAARWGFAGGDEDAAAPVAGTAVAAPAKAAADVKAVDPAAEAAPKVEAAAVKAPAAAPAAAPAETSETSAALAKAAKEAASEVDKALVVEQVAETPQQQAPAQPVAQTAAPAATGAAETALLVDTLHNKDAELSQAKQDLAAAQAEVAKLKDIVKKIYEVNRKEKLNLYYNLGCVYRAARQYDKAELTFLKALELDPNDAGVAYNLAILYDDNLKDKAKAKTYYQKFLELAPNDPDAGRVSEWLRAMGDETAGKM